MGDLNLFLRHNAYDVREWAELKGNRINMAYPKKMSTDAVLVAFTFHWTLVDLMHPESPTRPKLIAALAKVAQRSREDSGIPLESQELMQPLMELYKGTLAQSTLVASKLLATTATLDRVFNTINNKDPKSVVASYYCGIRMIQTNGQFDEIRDTAKEQFGAYWMWPVVWLLCSKVEVVKKRYDEEEAAGNLDYWQDECQKYANNYWTARSKDFEEMVVMEGEMRDRLREILKLD
jgi:hypothetical protein